MAAISHTNIATRFHVLHHAVPLTVWCPGTNHLRSAGAKLHNRGDVMRALMAVKLHAVKPDLADNRCDFFSPVGRRVDKHTHGFDFAW